MGPPIMLFLALLLALFLLLQLSAKQYNDACERRADGSDTLVCISRWLDQVASHRQLD